MSRTGYSVTIKNDAAILDGKALVHTWIELRDSKGKVKVISFSADRWYKALSGKTGHIDTDNELTDLIGRERNTVTFEIEKWQYDEMISRHNTATNFGKTAPRYDMFRDDDSEYNCVTYSDYILQAGGIDFLKNIQSPHGLRAKILALQFGLPGAIVDIAPNFSIVETVMDIKDGIDHVFDQEIGRAHV